MFVSRWSGDETSSFILDALKSVKKILGNDSQTKIRGVCPREHKDTHKSISCCTTSEIMTKSINPTNFKLNNSAIYDLTPCDPSEYCDLCRVCDFPFHFYCFS